MTKQINDQT